MKLLNKMPCNHPNIKNRQIFLKSCGISPARTISAGIAHSNDIFVAREKDAGKIIAGVDGLITREHNLFLSVTTADCLPIFLFEPKKEIVGMVHAGWRSLEKDIIANAIDKIKKLGGNLKDILVGIGPAICQKHYEVGPEVAEKFAKYAEALKKERDKMYLDLKKIAQFQLMKTGLAENNIEISPECTFELPEKYFSARRDLPLTNCPMDNNIQAKSNNRLHSHQLVRGKPAEIEAVMAVVGLKS